METINIFKVMHLFILKICSFITYNIGLIFPIIALYISTLDFVKEPLQVLTLLIGIFVGGLKLYFLVRKFNRKKDTEEKEDED